jgi:hypothetical protein
MKEQELSKTEDLVHIGMTILADGSVWYCKST